MEEPSAIEGKSDLPLLEIQQIISERASKPIVFKPQGYQILLRMPLLDDILRIKKQYGLDEMDDDLREAERLSNLPRETLTQDEIKWLVEYDQLTKPMRDEMLLACIAEPAMTLYELRAWLETLADNQKAILYNAMTELIRLHPAAQEGEKLKN